MAGWAADAALVVAIAAILAGCGGSRPHATDGPVAAVATRRTIEAARAAERARRYDRARALYRRAVDEAPDRPSAALAWRELGRALLFWGEIADGEAALARAVELDPADVAAWHDLGVVRTRRGDPVGAERALRRAISLAPDEPRPRIALGALLVRERRWRAALVEYRALQALVLPARIREAVARAIELVEAEAARATR